MKFKLKKLIVVIIDFFSVLLKLFNIFKYVIWGQPLKITQICP